MIRLISALSLFVISSSGWALSSSDHPVIIHEGTNADIVQYEPIANQPLEAWEIVTDWVDGVYLNYSRFPYGDVRYHGQKTKVCFANIEGNRFAGISENAARLRKALALVIATRLGRKTPITCRNFPTLLQHHPEFADLTMFFESF